ncbi:MAG TPA: ABC transporter ATP-binding protein [Candidatus Limnocylindrales bacterium]|nr:ABC transporter ATP-binding protein [Candidatus Limnocylindrales bacterium]
MHSAATVTGVRDATVSSSRSSAILFDGVTKRYRDTTALDSVSLELETGRTVALLGPNGAGKSTAIGLLLGLLSATSGTVRTLGVDPREAVARGRVGAMLQSSSLPTGSRVRELVELVRSLYPEPMPTEEVLARAGLEGLADRGVEGLSGGEAQRVRFALAIAGDPELVFLDEPTVGMDVDSRRSFWADMRRLAAAGRTILFATHYLDEADQAADRIVVLDRGRVVADGSAADLKTATPERTLRFTLDGAEAGYLRNLDGTVAVDVRGEVVTMVSRDSDATVRALARSDVAFANLEVTGPSLEAAFLALTGRNADA